VIKALHDAGAPLLTGTDSGIGLTSPGISLHDEFDEFVAAGLTPFETLRASTIDAAAFLQLEGEFGALVVGARADIVITDENPLTSIGTLRTPLAVMVRGRFVKMEL
jgi:imidazolonepropionase-like amidohydrolase